MAISRSLGLALVEHFPPASGGRGPILQFGRQHVYLTEAECHGRRSPAARLGRFVNDQRFFRALGFDPVTSCDLPGVGADIELDLNEPAPEALRGQFACVFDGGTLEHVFDVPAALRAMDVLLRVGGWAVHASPTNNFVDHGFYMLSPRLLHDWYTANDYEIERFTVFRHGRRWARSTWRRHDYVTGSLDRGSVGGFEQGCLLTLVVARKRVDRAAVQRPSQPGDGDRSRLPRVLDQPWVRRLLPLARPVSGSSVVRVWPGPVRWRR